MLKPKVVRAAVAVSLLTTGGTVYYCLSDGGDPDKLDMKLAEISASLAERRERWLDSGEKVREALSTWMKPTEELNAAVKSNSTTSSAEPNIDDQTVSSHQQENGNTRAICHSCSGPRLWFFAEKLRLKRRFTPHPDPSSD